MPLLGTKLHVPRPRRQLVPRGRLTDQLLGRPGAVPRLVLVGRPGRVRQDDPAEPVARQRRYASRADDDGSRVAWLSLDAADTDLRRFLAHLVAAVRGAAPEVGSRGAMALLGRRRPGRLRRPGQPRQRPRRLPGPTVLALDDYHVIDDAEVHEAVTFLLDHLPPQVDRRDRDPRRPAAAAGAPARPRRAGRAARRRPALHRRPRRPRSSTRSWASTSRRRTSRPWKRGPRAGPPGSSWPPCRCAAGDDAGGVRRRRSPAATASSSTTWSRRCSTASPTTCASSSSPPRCSSS